MNGDVQIAAAPVSSGSRLTLDGRADGFMAGAYGMFLVVYRPGPPDTVYVTQPGAMVPTDARFIGAADGLVCWAWAA
jgi:hypothetical protein